MAGGMDKQVNFFLYLVVVSKSSRDVVKYFTIFTGKGWVPDFWDPSPLSWTVVEGLYNISLWVPDFWNPSLPPVGEGLYNISLWVPDFWNPSLPPVR